MRGITILTVFIWLNSVPLYAGHEADCRTQVIASYKGELQTFNQIYLNQAGFWQPNWSPLLLKIKVKGAALFDELELTYNPCNGSVWLYPYLEKGMKYQTEVGKLRPLKSATEPGPAAKDESKTKSLLTDLAIHVGFEGLLHLLFH